MIRSAIRVSAFAGFTLFGVSAPDVHAQCAAPPEFEVASIKAVPPSDTALRASMLSEHGRINFTNITVRGLVRKAYGLRIYPPSVGGSDPLSTDRYNIIARSSSDVSEEQTMRMLQALLTERPPAERRYLRPEVILGFESRIRIWRVFRRNPNPGFEIGLRNGRSRCGLANRASDRVRLSLDGLALHEELQIPLELRRDVEI